MELITVIGESNVFINIFHITKIFMKHEKITFEPDKYFATLSNGKDYQIDAKIYHYLFAKYRSDITKLR